MMKLVSLAHSEEFYPITTNHKHKNNGFCKTNPFQKFVFTISMLKRPQLEILVCTPHTYGVIVVQPLSSLLMSWAHYNELSSLVAHYWLIILGKWSIFCKC
jgi:hypothetical protein